MSISLKKIQLSKQANQEQGSLIHSNSQGLVNTIEVQLNVRIGTVTLTIGELKQLKTGQILTLNQKTNESIELILNNQVIATGELMSYEDNFALKINEVNTQCGS